MDELKANPPKIMIQTTLVSQASANPQVSMMLDVNEQDAHRSKKAEIRIRDNGKGMSQEVMAQVFDHLFTTKCVGKGTGLGLAIAYQIVTETHAGTLTVQSKIDQGTEFCIQLPLA